MKAAVCLKCWNPKTGEGQVAARSIPRLRALLWRHRADKHGEK